MSVQAYQFETIEQEMSWVAKQIRERIDIGQNPGQIAVITRKNKHLAQFGKYLTSQNISFSHEVANDLLDQEKVNIFLSILGFINSLIDNQMEPLESALPSILSLPIWQIPSVTIFELSLIAKKNQQSWLTTMLTQPELGLSDLASFFLELARVSKFENLIIVIEYLLGLKPLQINHNPNTQYLSGWQQWLKNEDKYQYPLFLWQLNKILQVIAEQTNKKDMHTLSLSEFLTIIQEYKANQLAIPAKNPFHPDSLHLLSAHKAKGLEFELVFMIACSQENWSKANNKNTIKLPANLPLSAIKDDLDDFLRLLFVAITRAKNELVLTTTIDQKKPANSWAMGLETAIKQQQIIIQKPEIEFQANQIEPLFVTKEQIGQPKIQALLTPFLKSYRLSASDLCTYLDINNNGPLTILEKRLIKFPSPSSTSQIVGNLVHEILYLTYLDWQKNPNSTLTNQKPVYILALMQTKLKEHLPKLNLVYADKQKIGQLADLYLKNYAFNLASTWSLDSEVEKNFRPAKVELQVDDLKIPLTGSIDRLDFDHQNQTIMVVDYKSSSAFYKWPKVSKSTKTSGWKYRLQLIFYKILIESSNLYPNYQVYKGRIEFLKPDPKMLSQDTNLYQPLTKQMPILDLNFDPQEVEKIKQLIKVVYLRIMNQDFYLLDNSELLEMDVNQFQDYLIASELSPNKS